MFLPRVFLLIGISFSFFGCLSETKPSVSTGDETFGSILMRVSLAGSSSFKAIVRSGTVTVSANDMTTLVSALTLDDSSATAKIVGVPTGKARLVEIKAFDSLGVVRYQGAASVDVATDSNSHAVVVLKRLTGTVVVDGKVNEEDSISQPGITAWPSPVTVVMGAQASADFGATLDVDTRSAWTSATANANQEKIDLVFLFYGLAFHLDDAITARLAGIANSINLTNSYVETRIKPVDMVKIVAMPSSQEAGKRAFESTTVIHGSKIEVGDRFMVKTTEGKLALISVKSIVGTDKAGNLELNVYLLTIP